MHVPTWFQVALLSPALLWAQEAPPWGVGLRIGEDHAHSKSPYGTALGVEGSWQFLREHWIQGRLRATYLHMGLGSGREWMPGVTTRADMDSLGVSCDWIFRVKGRMGPYLVLGAGIHRYDVSYETTTRNPPAGPVVEGDSEQGGYLTLTGGLGYQFQRTWEVELRWDALPTSILTIFYTPPLDPAVVSLGIRWRF
ncbi:MAG: outer membrane beta-barrel protein [Acidobacteria bacterium]|nr:outer membrane beta-barrel protein [Acidobacteriota bacterium]